MGILLCEQNFRDVWRRNKSVRAEIGQILRTHTHAAKLVVEMATDRYSCTKTVPPGFLSILLHLAVILAFKDQVFLNLDSRKLFSVLGHHELQAFFRCRNHMSFLFLTL